MINICGQIASTSGYASHTRSLANALFKIMPTRLTTFIPQGFERELNDAEVEMINRKPENGEWNLIIDLPFNWPMHISGENNIGFCVWEGDRIPKSFIKNLEDPRIKYVFVPSEHTKQAILNTTKSIVISSKLVVIPHGVSLEHFFPTKKPEVFTFVFTGGFRNKWDRKGLQYALEAYLSEFKKGEAILRIHINQAYGNYITEYLTKIVKPDSPEIYLDFNMYPHNKLREIYQGHVLVSPSRAESYGLQVIEAMACGLPVIATGWSGYMDFLNNENGWLIDYKMEEIKNEVFYENTNWATPDIKQLRQVMRTAHSDPELLKKKGLNAIETAQNNTWDKTVKLIKDILK